MSRENGAVARPHVVRIESNAKGGVGVDLAPLTLVVGRNGSGKSRIVNAVELALTGRAGDLAGRLEVAREADLMALAPGRSGKLFAAARLSDGTLCEWSTSGTTETAKKSKAARFKDRPGVLPLRLVGEALRGSPDTARKFFLKRLGCAADRDLVLARIPEPLHPLYRQAIGACMLGDGEIDKLLFARQRASEGARESNSAAKAAREASAEAASGLPPPPTAQEIEAAKEAVAQARAAVERSAVKAAREMQLQQISARLGQLRQTAATAEARLAAADADLAASPEPPAIPELQKTCIAALHALAEAKAGHCLVCGEDSDGARRRIPERDASVMAQLASWRVAAAKHSDAASEHAAARLAAKASREALAQAEALLVPIEEHADALPPEEARARLEAAETRFRELDATTAAWETARRAAAPAASAGSGTALWKALQEACDEAIEALLDKAVEDFRARVQRGLPATDSFGLRLRDGGREVFQLGLVRDGVLLTALSGAEWARTIAATALACADPDGPCIVIPEERAFDPETLADACEALGRACTAAGAQVIVTSPVGPARMPAGFALVRTDG